jgi:Ca-activated chloride channel family protein
VAEIGVRYRVITPFTGLVVPGGARWYRSRLPPDPAGTFVPAALRGAPPPGERTRLALEPGWSTRGTRTFPLERLYRRALRDRIWTAVRASFDRKAAARPDLSGRVAVRVAVNPDGGVHKVEHLQGRSSLRDPDVVGDVLRLVRSLRLPATPTGERFTFVHVFRFDPRDISDVPQRCLRKDGTRKRSPESYRYLAVRRALWRERLWRKRTPARAHRVWRGALACGEIRLDTDARALLRLMLDAMRTTAQRVDLYHRLHRALPWVRAFVRREILRRVRTLHDVRAVRAGLALDGGLNRKLLDKVLEKAKTDADRIEVVRRFLSLSPRSLSLQVMLMRLLERTGKLDEARRLAWKLRANPVADAGVRQRVGAFFLRQGDTAEARRAFSEIVEFAPYDPWARRRLGHLLLAQAADAARHREQAGSKTAANKAGRWSRRLYADAYREYETLAWLNPGDDTVLLLMANAAAGMGRTDWALRLQQRVSQSAEAGRVGGGPAAWARLLSSVRLAELRQANRSRPDRLARVHARGRRMGLHGWARDVTLAARWNHPDARLSLWVRYPGRQELQRAPLRGGAVGIEGLRRRHAGIWGAAPAGPPPDRRNRPDRRAPGRRRGPADVSETPLYLELRSGDRAPDRVQPYYGVLWLLWKEGKEKERIQQVPVTFGARVRARAFHLTPQGRLEPTEVQTPPGKLAARDGPAAR